MNILLTILALISTSPFKTASGDEYVCEMSACEALEACRMEISEQGSSFNVSGNSYTYELVKLERRVRSLEQPIWKISSSTNRWIDCARGPCKCKPEIRSLSCWNTHIATLPDDQIVPEDIRSLDLGINFLTTLNEKAFQVLPNILEIDLFDNRIDYLPKDVFNKLVELQYLRIHRNVLEELSGDTFLALKGLRTLDLSNNNLRALPKSLFRTCEKLVILHLSGNRLTDVPATIFYGLNLLEDLDLSENSVKTLDTFIFKDLLNLRRLKLAENDIEDLKFGTFDNLSSVEYLSLRKNRLTKVSGKLFSNMHSLKVLEISANKIVKLDPGNFNLKRLDELHIQQNFLYELPEDLFVGTTNLKKLLLFSNNLEELRERSFNGLLNLKSLLLNNNLLTKIHPSVFSFAPNLQKLRLDSNKFLFLPSKSLDGLENLTSIKLTKNPWHCDCSILYLSVWIYENSNKLWDSQPTCKGPGKLGGADIKDMNFDSLCHGQWASMVHLAARVPVRQPAFTPHP